MLRTRRVHPQVSEFANTVLRHVRSFSAAGSWPARPAPEVPAIRAGAFVPLVPSHGTAHCKSSKKLKPGSSPSGVVLKIISADLSTVLPGPGKQSEQNRLLNSLKPVPPRRRTDETGKGAHPALACSSTLTSSGVPTLPQTCSRSIPSRGWLFLVFFSCPGSAKVRRPPKKPN